MVYVVHATRYVSVTKKKLKFMKFCVLKFQLKFCPAATSCNQYMAAGDWYLPADADCIYVNSSKCK